jgi:hypothetical protein
MARKTLGILMVLVGFASMTTLLSAHHSRAMYDVEQLVSVEGVVTNVEWRNPHMWITLDVPGPNGKPESWGFEGAADSQGRQQGQDHRAPSAGQVQAHCRVHGHGSERQVLFAGNGLEHPRHRRELKRFIRNHARAQTRSLARETRHPACRTDARDGSGPSSR